MLTSDAPTLGDCNANALDFWHLRISKTFKQPEYYIGQTVWHQMRVNGGEILHPVRVIGLYWTRISWDYAVSLPEDHPWFEVDDRETEWIDESQLEAM